MNRQLKIARIIIAFAIAAVAAACSNGSLASPTSPTTPTTPQVPASPTVTLNGRVTETAPTTHTGIGRATVRVTSGPSAGQSATTNSMGYYTIPDVTVGSTIEVSAEGYVGSSRGLETVGELGQFQLMPLPTTKTSALRDTLSDKVGKCSDGVTERPCHILTIPVHNDGPLDATLTWEPAIAADLNLSLFRTSPSALLSRAATNGGNQERITADVKGGTVFELRVTYASGTAAPTYALRVTHPN